MLDTPIAELTVRNDVDAAQDLVDARTLFEYTWISFLRHEVEAGLRSGFWFLPR